MNNNFYFKLLMFLAIPILANAESLKSLLEYAGTKNQLVAASAFLQKSKAKELEAQKSSYYPTIDIGLLYQRLDARSLYIPGDIYSGYAKIGFDIYDGGKKSSLVEQKKRELESSTFDTQAIKDTLSLQIVQEFYYIKNLEANLIAYKEAKISLLAQLKRIEKFYEAKVATKDDVDRLQSAYDTNIYEIESIKFQILSAKKSLGLKVSKEIDLLDDSRFKEQTQDDFELIESTKSLMAKKESIVSSAESLRSIYYPQIRLEDTYSVYDYDRSDLLHPESVDKQNKIMLTLNLRVFDNSSTKYAKQAIIINTQSINKQIEYQIDEQKMQHELSLHRIQTSKIKIKSALSALVSATSAFKTIEEKYDAGLVENVVYLDALTAKTRANALYETSLNDLEVAYAMHYYHSGKKLEEFLQ